MPIQGSPTSRTELLARFEGDAELLQQVATDFLERSAVLTHRLRIELACGEMGSAARTAHTLKGLIAYVDRGVAFDLAGRLQLRADDEDCASAQALLAPLDMVVEALRTHLREEVCDGR